MTIRPVTANEVEFTEQTYDIKGRYVLRITGTVWGDGRT